MQEVQEVNQFAGIYTMKTSKSPCFQMFVFYHLKCVVNPRLKPNANDNCVVVVGVFIAYVFAFAGIVGDQTQEYMESRKLQMWKC